MPARHQALDTEAVERHVELNLRRRQRFLSGEGRRGFLEEKGDVKPQLLWLILDETALRRAIGGRHVMRAQQRRRLARHGGILLPVPLSPA
ncbi:Scr1 family TA system antitoxin-like transcriptional regulator [Streptomyces chattanoogensis]